MQKRILATLGAVTLGGTSMADPFSIVNGSIEMESSSTFLAFGAGLLVLARLRKVPKPRLQGNPFLPVTQTKYPITRKLLAKLRWLTPLALLAAATTPTHAVIIDFESYASAGSVASVNAGTPYTEDGFTLVPWNPWSPDAFVFDSAAFSDMPGNATDWFGFENLNPILLTVDGASSFDLIGMDLGRMEYFGPSTDFIITGFLTGGGTVVANFDDITTTAAVVLNWSNLSAVILETVGDPGAIDNVNVTSVPDSRTTASLALGVLGLLAMKRQLRASA